MTEIAWYWHFLGLKPGASKAEIKSAYHRLAKLLHRDHGGTDEDMQRLNEAYHLALADNGSAYQEPPKAEPRDEPPPPPRQEPPPPPRPQATPKREPFFTPAARNAVWGLIQTWGLIVIAAVIWSFIAGLYEDAYKPDPRAASTPAVSSQPHVPSFNWDITKSRASTAFPPVGQLPGERLQSDVESWLRDAMAIFSEDRIDPNKVAGLYELDAGDIGKLVAQYEQLAVDWPKRTYTIRPKSTTVNRLDDQTIEVTTTVDSFGVSSKGTSSRAQRVTYLLRVSTVMSQFRIQKQHVIGDAPAPGVNGYLQGASSL